MATRRARGVAPGVPAVNPGAEPEAQRHPVREWPAGGLPADILQLLSEPLDPALVARRRGPRDTEVLYIELCGMEPKA